MWKGYSLTEKTLRTILPHVRRNALTSTKLTNMSRINSTTMKEFLKKYNISEEDYEKTGLKWKDLLEIKSKYESIIGTLEPPAKYLLENFHKVENVHSVRYRLKNPEKLIAKIIRKRINEPERIIDIHNFQLEITDLIGLRILHLFKEDWLSIHNYIMGNWDPHETPIAYIRKGDSSEYVKGFEEYGCKIMEHPYGYRSVHYVINIKPGKTSFLAEIQVRTIFEEAWSEIDHSIRYPYYLNNLLLNQFLVLFNRLAGSADEMGSFVAHLKNQLIINEQEYQASITKKTQIIESLRQEIAELKLKPKQVTAFGNSLDEILKMAEYTPPPFTITGSSITDYGALLNSEGIVSFGKQVSDVAKLYGSIDWSDIIPKPFKLDDLTDENKKDE